MTSWNLRAMLFVSALSAGTLQCGESELEKQCVLACRSEYCNTDASEAFFDNCRDSCVGRQADAELLASECGEKHDDLLACIISLPCEDVGPWVDDRGKGGTYPCSEVSEKFAAACPGLWFAP